MLLNSVSMSLRKDTKNAKKKYILKTRSIFPINLFSIWWQKPQSEKLKARFTRSEKLSVNVLMIFTQFQTYTLLFSNIKKNRTQVSIQ